MRDGYKIIGRAIDKALDKIMAWAIDKALDKKCRTGRVEGVEDNHPDPKPAPTSPLPLVGSLRAMTDTELLFACDLEHDYPDATYEEIVDCINRVRARAITN